LNIVLTFRTFRQIREDKCEICGGAPNIVHHKDFDWTNNIYSNAMTLCKKCHQNVHSKMFPNPGWSNLDPYNNIGRKMSKEERENRSKTHRKRHPLDLDFIMFCKKQGLTIVQTAKIIGWSYEGLSRRLVKEKMKWSNIEV
jgi:hypothetical protein